MQSNNCAEIFGTSRQITFVWPIENYRRQFQKVEPIKARFYFDDSKTDGWNVILYPRGSKGYSDDLELSMQFTSRKNNHITVTCSITIHELPTYLMNPRLFTRTFENGKIHVINSFLTNTMLTKLSKLKRGGSCTIQFLMHFRIRPDSSSPSQLTSSSFPENCLINDLSLLHDNSKLTDVTINVGDEHYSAHKIILAARSPVFSTMFENSETLVNQNTRKTRSKKNPDYQIDIKDFTPKIVKELLRYIYTDRVNIFDEIVRDLLVAANKYGLENLKLKCSRFIFDSIKKDNAAEILIFADREDIATLRADVVAYINDNLEEIIETAGYTDLEKNRPYLLGKLLRASAKRPRLV